MDSITKNRKPAILGYNPIFDRPLQITMPDVPSWDMVKEHLEKLFTSTFLTKGPYLKEFEEHICQHLNVKNAVGLSSCTTGLLLAYKLLDLKGEVILPSFTFMATGQALMWIENVIPVFVDVDPETFNISPEEVEKAITPQTSAIIGVHVYGNPANIDELTNIAQKYNLKLIFDAAHGLGGTYKGTPIGNFGDLESFSCSPTKLLITGEGGIATTNNDELAEKLVISREYGNPGNYDSIYPGLNGRMAEFNAILGIESLKKLDEVVKKRNEFAICIKNQLQKIPGIKFQKINKDDLCTYKDLTLLIGPEFGLSRDQLGVALNADNVITRNYYSPPLHRQTNYRKFFEKYENKLPVTDKLSNNAITIPLSSLFTMDILEKLVFSIENIYKHRDNIKSL